MILEEADLAQALTPPTDGDDNKTTVVTLTPEDAHNILSTMNYARHRRISASHVGNIAEAMATGKFTELRQITFAPDHEGNPVLIDGQHRLQAAINADWTGRWVMTCLWGKEDRADEIYMQLDTSQKERKPRTALSQEQ